MTLETMDGTKRGEKSSAAHGRCTARTCAFISLTGVMALCNKSHAFSFFSYSIYTAAALTD